MRDRLTVCEFNINDTKTGNKNCLFFSLYCRRRHHQAIFILFQPRDFAMLICRMCRFVACVRCINTSEWTEQIFLLLI